MTERELYKKISEELDIPIERIIAYDKLHWKQLKIDMNNPEFAVYELPHLGTFTITPVKLRNTLRYHLKILKDCRKKIQRAKRNNPKLLFRFEAEKENFRRLWKLKNEMIKERYEDFERQIRNDKKRREKSREYSERQSKLLQ